MQHTDWDTCSLRSHHTSSKIRSEVEFLEHHISSYPKGLTYQKLSIKVWIWLDLRSYPLDSGVKLSGLHDHSLTQFPFQAPQQEISFHDVGNRKTTTAIVPLTAPEILIFTIKFLFYLLKSLLSPRPTLLLWLYRHTQPNSVYKVGNVDR